MKNSTQTLSSVKDYLPQTWHEPVDALAESTLQSNRPLRLILVGAFTVGKSSLLNMLLGEHLLQTALEETTALPTFIEYGAERTMQLIGHDESICSLNEAGFARATTQAPEGAACAAVTLPIEWLQGVSIIDLPGLGSVSSTNRDYTLSQIQQADAILYLIAPRGPDTGDIATLNQIRQYGKRVKIIAARWDQVDEAVAAGEKQPSLEQWGKQIETESGIKARIAPASKTGLGRDEIVDFIRRSQGDIAAIRLRRFYAELRPLLENALGQNAEAQRACEARSDEAIQTLHTELIQQKQALSDLKSSLYEKSQQDRSAIDEQSTTLIRQGRGTLDSKLKKLASLVKEEASWDDFGNHGADVLRAALTSTANMLSGMSESYGKLELPEAQVNALNLRIPPAESVAAQDFLDMARLSQLQIELDVKQADFAAKEKILAQLPAVNLNETERELQALMHERYQVASQPLPEIVQRVSSGGGAALGRMIGEVADIGLLFVNPAIVGTKIASLVGKSAKLANIAIKTKQVAKNVTKGVKVIQAAQLDKKVAGVPPQAIDKLGMLGALEMLSLGHWGERLGSMLGGGPRDEVIIDPEAQAQQQQSLQDLDARLRTVRSELARNEDIANEHQLTGWALEQNVKEQLQLKGDLAALTLQAEQKHQKFAKAARVERQQMVERHVERAVVQWLRNFDQQSISMTELLRARVKSHWEDRVDALVGERITETQALAAQVSAAPADKAAALARLQQDAVGLQAALGALV